MKKTIDISMADCYIMSMKTGKSAQKSYRNIRTYLIILLLTLFATLPVTAEQLHSDILTLRTNVVAEITFEMLQPSPVSIVLGDRDNSRFNYNFQANAITYLTISSANYSGSTMRLKHSDIDVEAYIPYQMFFDYDGDAAPGGETLVQENIAQEMGGYNNGYDISGTFSFLTYDYDIALAGDYVDEITFSFTAQ